ncbi:HET-domain-containing protein [Tothia fuscella]|uniref:HET-domain-containing protein n=1 Tax=Tothia fuscella TaxID=1048955 RepID=A0A9P4NZV2_9PEZI|nr:HET-domain-containing protein [Tothia fuscella]
MLPLNISTAGKHDFTERADIKNFLEMRAIDYKGDSKELHQHFNKLRRHNRFVTKWFEGSDMHFSLNLGLGHPENRFFVGDRQLSEDEWYALILPYYSSKLQLQPIDKSSTVMMDLYNSYDNDDTTESTAAQVLISCWDYWCRSAHPYCKLASDHNQVFLPNRILDIGWVEGAPPTVRLISPLGDTRRNYATLSHCWGRTQPLRTLRSNIVRFHKKIKWSALPKTFVDAIYIARRRSLKYLWIDSLCIIQDSAQDWEEQSAQMGSIYRNCDICIAASASSDASGGCFRARDGLHNRPVKLWETAPDVLLPKVYDGTLYALSAGDNVIPEEPLEKRAWVLQEKLLSPRCISFTKTGVTWSCLTADVSEEVPHMMHGFSNLSHGTKFNYKQIFHAGISGLLDLSSETSDDQIHFYPSWMLIAEQYSQRKLTKSSDRLAALTGVAIEFEQAASDHFFAGLWRRYLWRELLWTVYSPTSPRFGRLPLDDPSPSRPQRDFTAPSWSWAAVDGAIEYFPMFPIDAPSEHEVLITVLSASCSPSGARSVTNHYSGELLLRGPLKPATTTLNGPSMHYSELAAKFKPIPTTAKDFKMQVIPSLVAIKTIVDAVDAKRQNLQADQELSTISTYTNPKQRALEIPDGQEEIFEAQDKAPQGKSPLPPFTQYLRDLDDGAFIPGREWNQGLKDHALQSLQQMEAGNDMSGTRYAGHPLKHPETGEQIGYWAPDYEGTEIDYQITCLAVSKFRNYVLCLGIEPVGKKKRRYKRVGVAFWYEKAWDEMLEADVQEVCIV